LKILVTGGTGKVGRELAACLLKGGNEVDTVSRNPDAANLPEGVRLSKVDLSKPEQASSLAMKDIDAIFLNPGAVENAASELLTRATRDGVKQAVLLSAITVEYGGGYRRFAERFRAIEEIVRASGLEWTFLRSADFAANSAVWIPQILTGDVVRGAYGNAKTSPIHERDIATMAAEAFKHKEEHVRKAYAITGPESLSQFERVRIIGEVIGRNLRFEEIPPELARAAMLAQGVPSEVPDRMLGYLSACLAEPGPTTTTVKKILGRSPLSFAQWVSEHKVMFGS